MNDVVHIVPEVVVVLDVLVKATFRLLVEVFSSDVANVTERLLVLYYFFLLVPQLREGVNDDTRQNVQHDDVHDDVEACVVEQLDEVVLRVLVVLRFGVVADSSTEGQALVNDRHVAEEHRLSHVLSDPV